MYDREVLSILPSPSGFFVARYESKSLLISPVAMWALVKYKGIDEEFERIEPVSFDVDLGMRVGNTEHGADNVPADAVILAQHAVTVHWTEYDGRVVGTIEVTDSLPGGPAVQNSIWGAKRVPVDGPPPPKGV